MESVIVHPTLREYHERVKTLANKYGVEIWLELSADNLNFEDRFEYSFIISAVGEELIQLEFADMFQSPSHINMTHEYSTEPGLVPGSFIFTGVKIECPAICGHN